jgi:hypothetical protein
VNPNNKGKCSNNNFNNIAAAIDTQSHKPQVPLFIINAHSTSTNDKIEIDERFKLLHYCPEGCKLRTITHTKGNSKCVVRRVSIEHACIRDLEVVDTLRFRAPNYTFTTNPGEDRHGLFYCDGRTIVRIHTLNPRQFYTIPNFIRLILNYLEAREIPYDSIELGIMACKTACKEAPSVYALPEGCGKVPSHECFGLRNNLNWNRQNTSKRNRSQNWSQSQSPGKRRSGAAENHRTQTEHTNYAHRTTHRNLNNGNGSRKSRRKT